MPRKLLACSLVFALAALGARLVHAQDAVLSQFYGSGVHAFFAGQYSKASEELTTAIDSGSKDPRAYYFRGLTRLKFGQTDEAKADFERGAQLETGDSSRFPVSKSLERVQGSDRVTLERYRAVARASNVARTERRMQARYEALRRREADKLRRVARPRIEQAQPAAALEPVRNVGVGAAARTQKAPAAAAAGDDPFAPTASTDTPMGNDVADPDNPFGDGAVEGADPASGDAPAAGDSDPFNLGTAPAAEAEAESPMPAAGDGGLFGTEAPAEAPAEGGAAEPPAGGTDNPFGDDGAMPEEAKPAEPANTEPASTEPASTEPAPATEENPFGS